MNAKNNRHNHDFQIETFLLGQCHTVDGAYALACDLRQNRKSNLALLKSVESRIQSRIWWGRILKYGFCWFPPLRYWGMSILEAIYASREEGQLCVTAAEKELAFIERCIEALQPHRKFKHLPDDEAHEAAQRGEWCGEIASRLQLDLLTTGRMNKENLRDALSHPDFREKILPQIEHLKLNTLVNKTNEVRMLVEPCRISH